MRIHFWSLLICSFLVTYLEASANKNSMDKLGFHNYNEIVRDLIKNWESPIVYLRQLGYLPSDYEDTSKIKPNLDALMSRIEGGNQPESLGADEAKAKDQFCGTADTKKLQVKKKRASLQQKRKSLKAKTKRQQREATGNLTMNYPNMEQMMAMTQQSKQVLQQQEPAIERTNSNHDTNEEMLQRLVEKTSPQRGPTVFPDGPKAQQQAAGIAGSPQMSNMPLSPLGATAMLQFLSDNNAKKASEIPSSNNVSSMGGAGENSAMSMYGTLLKSIVKTAIHSPQSSRQDQAQTRDNVQPEIEAPQYLNWDIQNKRLKQISPYAKDAYVDKLVQIFVKKQETMDILQHKRNDT